MDHRLAPRRVIGDHKNCRDFWVVNKSAKVMTSSSVKIFTIHHAYRIVCLAFPMIRLDQGWPSRWKNNGTIGISVVSMVLQNVSFWWRISYRISSQWFTKGYSQIQRTSPAGLRPTPRATTTKNPTGMPWKCCGNMMFVAKIAMMRSYGYGSI